MSWNDSSLTCLGYFYCGNGEVNGAEECDDGSIEDGDGCDMACMVEDGWSCGVSGDTGE